ncbi:MaoC/PaaZ C-terminal domain-containing protein [Providencia sp.]
MKTLRYTLKDAHNWAEFSGDYNPIHFDLPWVQAHGGDKLSVHGMRALLDVKLFSSQQLSSVVPKEDQAIKCVIRIRHPLWNDVEYSLVAGNKLGSSAVLMADGQKCVTCNLSLADQVEYCSAQSSTQISAIDLLNLQQIFTLYFPKLPLWVFLDAVIFQYLIETNAVLQQDGLAALLPKNASLKDIFAEYSVVQTHQELHFDPTFLQLGSLESQTQALNIHIQPAIITGDVDSGLLVCIQAVAEYQHKYITNSITLKISNTHS